MNEKQNITQIARELRRSQTDKEKLLWKELRNRKLNGNKFFRQHPIHYENDLNGSKLYFIADFYCAEKGLVIELDGKIHDFREVYDKNRDSILNELVYRVVHIKNEEMLDIKKVKEKISNFLLTASRQADPPLSIGREGVGTRDW